MRFLVLQDRETPAWVYNEVERQVQVNGHTLVKWTMETTFGKDYDGILGFPRPSYIAHKLCQDHAAKVKMDESGEEDYDDDGDNDDTTVTIGKGLYQGLSQSMPHVYVIVYDTDHASDIARDTILMAQNIKITKFSRESDFGAWGEIDMAEATVSLITKGFKVLADREKAIPYSIISMDDQYKSLLLIRRRRR